jgi:DNA-binding GntR family transcriptional regulator
MEMVVTDTQRAYELLKDKIVTTQMPPGAVIREGDLMAELGLGRTPIREALKLLEAQHLVSVSPRRGMFVAPINIADLGEIEELRSVLDPLCVRLAAGRIVPAEVASLAEIIQHAHAVEASGDVPRLLALDRRFHRVLAVATRNELLQSQLEMLYDLSMRIWYFYLGQVDPEDLAFDALVEVIEALAAGDAARAENAMCHHIQHFGESIKRCL